MKKQTTKTLNVLLSLAAGALLLSASVTVAHAESLSFAGIEWNDDRQAVTAKLKRNNITLEDGGKMWLDVSNLCEFQIDKIQKICDIARNSLERPTEYGKLIVDKNAMILSNNQNQNKIVNSFNIRFSEIGKQVPIIYTLQIRLDAEEGTIDTIIKKYGDFAKLPTKAFFLDQKDFKYIENGNDLLIYYKESIAATNKSGGSIRVYNFGNLSFVNLDNLQKYLTMKVEHIRAADQAKGAEAKEAAKGLF